MKRVVSLLSGAAVILLSCAPDPPVTTSVIFTTITPHRYLVRRIAGNRWDVQALISPGQDPHSFTVTPSRMAALSRARIFFRTGIEFEHGLVPKLRKNLPGLQIVDLRKGLILRSMITSHGDHHHEGTDPHIWLAPPLVRQQVKRIYAVLRDADPAGATDYKKNLDLLLKDLEALDTYLHSLLDELKGADMFVFHPAFGYFADTYGLNQVAVESGGKEPSIKALSRIIKMAQQKQIKAIFIQPEFSAKSARALADEAGCTVLRISSLPDNYLADMKILGQQVRKGLSAR